MQAPGLESYKELLLFLGTAGVIVPLFGRLQISPILGFVMAGVALGPFGLGALTDYVPWISAISIGDVGQIAHLAEFGVAFLLFMIALELSWERLQLMRRLVFGLGLLQVAVSSAVLALIAFLLGQSPASATVLGCALALSSTALVIPSLAERKRLNSAAGRAIFAVLLLQDLAVAPLLFMIAMLGSLEGAGFGTGLAYALAPAVLALAILVGLGRLILRPLFQLVAATKSDELFVAACLLVVIGTGLATAASGLSMALGAFIAGLLLAETEYRRQVEVTIQPFQGLLLGLFFVSVGARLDLSYVLANPMLTLSVAFVFVAIKNSHSATDLARDGAAVECCARSCARAWARRRVRIRSYWGSRRSRRCSGRSRCHGNGCRNHVDVHYPPGRASGRTCGIRAPAGRPSVGEFNGAAG